MQDMVTRLVFSFREFYGTAPEFIFFCPGRVNLIGDHIDYSGGMVMPCAINYGTFLAISTNSENVYNFRSLDYSGVGELSSTTAHARQGTHWFNFPLGILQLLREAGMADTGLNTLFAGNLPVGAGLSSSASIEMVIADAVNTMFELGISPSDLAILGKRTENEFIGLNSGIMDQFAVMMGKEGQAILLDCETLDFRYIPFDVGDNVLAVINTNKRRSLAESRYNERFGQCQAALKELQAGIKVEHLCDLDQQTFEKHRHLITDPLIARRAEHAVMENLRVKEAAELLEKGDIGGFGKLLYASHYSLRDLYEASGNELDAIVDFCEDYEAVAGARMTGAGFGGCAIALVRKSSFRDFSNRLSEYYNNRIGYACTIFAAHTSDGPRELEWKKN